MTPEIIIHADHYPIEKASLRTYVDLNLAGKMDTYIQKHHTSGAKSRVELTVEKQKDGKAKGKLIITLSSGSFRSERENFNHLDDLVNHLFTHIKEQLID